MSRQKMEVNFNSMSRHYLRTVVSCHLSGNPRLEAHTFSFKLAKEDCIITEVPVDRSCPSQRQRYALKKGILFAFITVHIKQTKGIFLMHRILVPFGFLMEINLQETTGPNIEKCTYLVMAKVSVRGEALLD